MRFGWSKTTGIFCGSGAIARYRWPARQPSIYHDMLRFEGGKWVRYGDSEAGRQAQGIYEDRITMFVDDGSVPEFARYGGYVAVGDRMRFFTNEAKAAEVRAHPYLGQKLKQTEVRKYLPATRRDINDWASIVPEEELAAMEAAEAAEQAAAEEAEAVADEELVEIADELEVEVEETPEAADADRPDDEFDRIAGAVAALPKEK